MTQHLIPSIIPLVGTDEVFALLSTVADPEKHKLRLQELIEHQKAAEERIAEHKELIAKTRGMHSAAEATNIVLDNRKQALDDREAEIEEKAQALATAETMRSAAALDRRERAVAAREDSAKRENDRLSAIRTDYEAKLAKLSNLADTLSGTR